MKPNLETLESQQVERPVARPPLTPKQPKIAKPRGRPMETRTDD